VVDHKTRASAAGFAGRRAGVGLLKLTFCLGRALDPAVAIPRTRDAPIATGMNMAAVPSAGPGHSEERERSKYQAESEKIQCAL